MKNIVIRPISKLEVFEVDRQFKEIKRALSDLPILFGKGSPEGEEKATVGTLFLRLDGGTGSTLYVKESGDGTATGWIAK